MRHILWLMPLMLSISLMIWCYNVPLDDTFGRQSLALLFAVLSGMGFMLMLLEKLENNHAGR